MQNTRGDPTDASHQKAANNQNVWQTAVSLQEEFGFGIFFDGISPKLLRAAVNHSVTFFVYDLILRTVADYT